jgi:hypothetical protein
LSLSDAFNRDFYMEKTNNSVLRIHNNVTDFYYDFAQRVVITGHGSAIPFSQFDRETLIFARDKLVELKGNPPELPPEAPATQAASRKFNL